MRPPFCSHPNEPPTCRYRREPYIIRQIERREDKRRRVQASRIRAGDEQIFEAVAFQVPYGWRQNPVVIKSAAILRSECFHWGEVVRRAI